MDKIPDSKEKNHQSYKISITVVFWMVGLTIGILFSIFIPYGAGFDENQHAIRIFGISGLDLVPNTVYSGEAVFEELFSLSYQRRFYQEPAWDLFSKDLFFLKGDLSELVPYSTWSIYFPAIYLPQAFVAGLIWRVFSLPIIPGLILCRVTGLLVYLIASYFALKLVPQGKLLFLVLFLSPTALFQASTLNADGFTNAGSFLFIAMILNMLMDKSTFFPCWKIWILMGSVLLLGVAKPGAVFILPLLFLISFHRLPSRAYKTAFIVSAVIALLINIGWLLFSIKNSQFAEGESVSLGNQLLMMSENPGAVVSLFFTWLLKGIKGYYLSWVGMYGHWVGVVPGIIYVLYPVAVIIALVSEKKPGELSIKQRGFFFLTFLLAFLVISGFYFYAIYPPDITNQNRHGRYLTAIAPMFFMAFHGLVVIHRLRSKIAFRLVVSILISVIVLFSIGLYATYYTYCGSSYYTFKQCVQPVYKNMDEETTPVLLLNHDVPLLQDFQSVCGSVTDVEVFISDVTPGQSGSLLFELLGESGVSYASATVPLSSITPMAYLHLPVNPEVEQVGDSYGIALLTSGMDPSASISLACTEYDVYKLGDLYYASQPNLTSLIFHYQCQSPWNLLFLFKNFK